MKVPLQGHHNEPNAVTDDRRLDSLLNRLFRCTSNKASKLRVAGLCEGNSAANGEFPAQKASNAENVSIDDVIMHYLRSVHIRCVNNIFEILWQVQYIARNMHTVFALLCFVVVIYWLIFPYPSGLLHWHCGNLMIAPVPAKQPWWIWITTSCEFIMNDCITTTKQSTTKPCAYFLGYTVGIYQGNFDMNYIISKSIIIPNVRRRLVLCRRFMYTARKNWRKLHFGQWAKYTRCSGTYRLNRDYQD